MITYEELGEMLDEIANEMANEMPNELYQVLMRELNGGVILLPEAKIHPESETAVSLYIMGEYNYQPRGLGRYITIYYGSFIKVYAYHTPAQQKDALRKVVYHEFTHHLESLAGDRSLERQDAYDIAKYKRRLSRKANPGG